MNSTLLKNIFIIMSCAVFISCVEVRSELHCDLNESTQSDRYRALSICQDRLSRDYWDDCHDIINEIFPGENCQRVFEYSEDHSWRSCSMAMQGTEAYDLCITEKAKYNVKNE